MSNDKPNANDLVNVTNLVPGDTAARTVTITNTGNADFTYTAAISATANTALWTDVTNGLQVTVKRGATTVYTGPLKNMALAASGTIAAGTTDTLSYDFAFPTSGTNAMQGSLNYSLRDHNLAVEGDSATPFTSAPVAVRSLASSRGMAVSRRWPTCRPMRTGPRSAASASRTSSSLNGLMTASIFFMSGSRIQTYCI